MNKWFLSEGTIYADSNQLNFQQNYIFLFNYPSLYDFKSRDHHNAPYMGGRFRPHPCSLMN